MSEAYDLTCVIHLHSTHSDGTGTVAQIAHAAARARIDVVFLTDHDTLAARDQGEERWHDDVLVLVGTEISPMNRDHFLAFGIDKLISRNQSGVEIAAAVQAAGGFGFAAHPFSRGNARFRQIGYPFGGLEHVDGIELWSFLNDTGERIRGPLDIAKMIWAPQRIIGGPIPENLAAWDELCRHRRVVAIGGLDAHQFGIRLAGRVPIRAMGYKRSFEQLHTHVLVDAPLEHHVDRDRARVYQALREGRCYIANDKVAGARGFAFWADGVPMGAEAKFESGRALHVRTPAPATIRLLRDGHCVREETSTGVDVEAESAGVYRVEVVKNGRPWIYSNPVYMRA